MIESQVIISKEGHRAKYTFFFKTNNQSRHLCVTLRGKCLFSISVMQIAWSGASGKFHFSVYIVAKKTKSGLLP